MRPGPKFSQFVQRYGFKHEYRVIPLTKLEFTFFNARLFMFYNFPAIFTP